MPDISSVLKSEIARVARKAVKAELDALRSASAGYRKEIAALKRAVSSLQRDRASAEKKNKTKTSATQETLESESGGSRTRFSAKGLKTLRAKLGLSAHDFGRLAGASGQSIYNWERGKAPRPTQIEKIAALRGLGKKEAQSRLEALAQEA